MVVQGVEIEKYGRVDQSLGLGGECSVMGDRVTVYDGTRLPGGKDREPVYAGTMLTGDKDRVTVYDGTWLPAGKDRVSVYDGTRLPGGKDRVSVYELTRLPGGKDKFSVYLRCKTFNKTILLKGLILDSSNILDGFIIIDYHLHLNPQGRRYQIEDLNQVEDIGSIWLKS